MKLSLKSAIAAIFASIAAATSAQFNTPWEEPFNGTSDAIDKAYALAIDRQGNTYVTGQSAATTGGINYVTAKYDSGGNEVWTQPYDNTGVSNGTDIATAIAVDHDGNIYVTGYSMNSSGNYDYLTRKYDPSGGILWTTRQTNLDSGHGDYNEYARDIAVDASGRMCMSRVTPSLAAVHCQRIRRST